MFSKIEYVSSNWNYFTNLIINLLYSLSIKNIEIKYQYIFVKMFLFLNMEPYININFSF